MQKSQIINSNQSPLKQVNSAVNHFDPYSKHFEHLAIRKNWIKMRLSIILFIMMGRFQLCHMTKSESKREPNASEMYLIKWVILKFDIF